MQAPYIHQVVHTVRKVTAQPARGSASTGGSLDTGRAGRSLPQTAPGPPKQWPDSPQRPNLKMARLFGLARRLARNRKKVGLSVLHAEGPSFTTARRFHDPGAPPSSDENRVRFALAPEPQELLQPAPWQLPIPVSCGPARPSSNSLSRPEVGVGSPDARTAGGSCQARGR